MTKMMKLAASCNPHPKAEKMTDQLIMKAFQNQAKNREKQKKEQK